MDAKKTIEKLKGESDRIRMSLYLSKSTFEDFKKACGTVAPSRVMEELMRDFIEDLKKAEKPKRKQKN